MDLRRDPLDLSQHLAAVRRSGAEIGFVPTMGALHEGHMALCHASVAQNHISVVSIFVNPLQFGPGEDFERYPRNLQEDCDRLAGAGIDLVFAPEREVLYPPGFSTFVEVMGLTDRLEGVQRPGHFRGVTTIVLKLFHIVGPCRAYFGEKDFQQLQVVRRMAADLNVPVEIHGIPTVREPDGLALSSRNGYLSPAERSAAPGIYHALEAAAELARRGERDGDALVKTATDFLEQEPLIKIEYVAVVDPDTLLPVSSLENSAVMAIAARLGPTRLIDNRRIQPANMAPRQPG